MKKQKTILSLSGGLDSTVLLAHLLDHGYDTLPVNFLYPSKHNRYEKRAAKAVASYYDINLHVINLTQVMEGFKSNLLLSGSDIPEEHYNHPSMSKTVIPARNMIFISILAGLAQSKGIRTIHLAIHSGDHHIYPDCRPDFYFSVVNTISYATNAKVMPVANFLYKTKAQIVKKGIRLNAPLHLTRTCYKNQPTACGKCGSCIERLEAFKQGGFIDPIIYQSRI